MPDTLRIGTRGSKLALAQTHWAADALRRAHPGLAVEITVIHTRGDATQAANVPLASFAEKGIFAKELEAALLAGDVDLAVHSMKDLEHTLPQGLVIAAVPEREDPRDALIGSTLDALPHGARVGTGSVRRRALLWSRRPDLQMLEVRGNVDTRLRRWREGRFDVLCLAVAGLNRLGLQSNITEILDPDWFTPDPGQGALALQAREGDARVFDRLQPLDDAVSHANVRAERAFLRALGGGCKTPVGALATGYGWSLAMQGMAASPDGTRIVRSETWGGAGATSPERHGEELAAGLRAQGADTLLAAT
jgi:hydroxymethylbilane synthase